MTAEYKAAIVGLGRIGWLFGVDAEGSSLSHRAAYEFNAATDIAFAVSPVEEERGAFERSGPGRRAFASVDELLEHERPDIVSICSPTCDHARQVELCLQRDVPMVWLEKPAASNSAQLRRLLELQRARGGSEVLVNFQRRYTSSYVNLRRAVEERRFGNLRRVDIRYSRGLETNGSHMADMLFFMPGLGGDYEFAFVGGGPVNPSFVLRYPSGLLVTFTGLDLEYHDIDFSVTCDEGRMSVLHGGMTPRVEAMTEHELFPSFYRLHDEGASFLGRGGFDHAFDKALADLLAAREGGVGPASSLKTALEGQLLVERVLDRVRP